MKNKNIFLALDTKDVNKALDIAQQVKDSIAGIKLGLEFFSATGPEGVKTLSQLKLPKKHNNKINQITRRATC